MATDLFNSLTRRLTNTVTRRCSLGALGLLGMANMALPDEATARKKRKKKKKNRKKNKGQATTTPAPTTTSTTTLAPGTCGAAGEFCGDENTTCLCTYNATDIEEVRCVAFLGFSQAGCLDDSACTDGKVCGLDANQENTACFALCPL